MRILLLLFLTGCSSALADNSFRTCNADMGECFSLGPAIQGSSVILFNPTTQVEKFKAAKISFRSAGQELFWIDSTGKIHFAKGVTREQVARAAVDIITRSCR